MSEASWQPIETAPKDGTSVLLCDGDRMEVCWWGKDSLFVNEASYWVYGECQGEYNDRQTFDHPSHWMPLPTPPEIPPAP
jgi:hypothetical protein